MRQVDAANWNAAVEIMQFLVKNQDDHLMWQVLKASDNIPRRNIVEVCSEFEEKNNTHIGDGTQHIRRQSEGKPLQRHRERPLHGQFMKRMRYHICQEQSHVAKRGKLKL